MCGVRNNNPLGFSRNAFKLAREPGRTHFTIPYDIYCAARHRHAASGQSNEQARACAYGKAARSSGSRTQINH